MMRLISLAPILFLLSGSVLAGTPTIQHWTSDHDLKVYFVRTDALPMVDIQLTFDAGSARDSDMPGLASMVNSLLAEGAAGRSAGDIAREFEDRGARFSSGSGRDSARVSLRSLNAPDTLSRSVDVLAKVVSRPNFDQDPIERERRRMLVALRNAERNPGAVAQRTFWSRVYGDHPYGSPPGGTEDSLQAIDREALLAFHQRYYVTRNAVLTIVGDLSRAEAEQIALHLGEALPAGERAERLPEPRPHEQSETVRIDMPSSQNVILVGDVGYARGDEAHFDLFVGNHILGGSGLVSRLGVAMREERGLSYGVSSSFSPMTAAGPFSITTQVRTDRTDEALELIHQQLDALRDDGPSDDEVDDAIRNITGSFPLNLDSNSKIAGFVSTIAFHGLPLDYLETFSERVEAVTATSIRESLQARLDPERMITVIVGPDAEDD
jgi:zinc protease